MSSRRAVKKKKLEENTPPVITLSSSSSPSTSVENIHGILTHNQSSAFRVPLTSSSATYSLRGARGRNSVATAAIPSSSAAAKSKSKAITKKGGNDRKSIGTERFSVAVSSSSSLRDGSGLRRSSIRTRRVASSTPSFSNPFQAEKKYVLKESDSDESEEIEEPSEEEYVPTPKEDATARKTIGVKNLTAALALPRTLRNSTIRVLNAVAIPSASSTPLLRAKSKKKDATKQNYADELETEEMEESTDKENIRTPNKSVASKAKSNPPKQQKSMPILDLSSSSAFSSTRPTYSFRNARSHELNPPAISSSLLPSETPKTRGRLAAAAASSSLTYYFRHGTNLRRTRAPTPLPSFPSLRAKSKKNDAAKRKKAVATTECAEEESEEESVTEMFEADDLQSMEDDEPPVLIPMNLNTLPDVNTTVVAPVFSSSHPTKALPKSILKKKKDAVPQAMEVEESTNDKENAVPNGLEETATNHSSDVIVLGEVDGSESNNNVPPQEEPMVIDVEPPVLSVVASISAPAPPPASSVTLQTASKNKDVIQQKRDTVSNQMVDENATILVENEGALNLIQAGAAVSSEVSNPTESTASYSKQNVPQPSSPAPQRKKPSAFSERLDAIRKAHDESRMKSAQALYNAETSIIQMAYRIKYMALQNARDNPNRFMVPFDENIVFEIKEKDRIFSGTCATFQPKNIFESSDEDEEEE